MLAQRVASAVVGIPLLFGLIWIDGVAYVIVAAVALAIAAVEFQHPRHGWFGAMSIITAACVAAMALGASAGIDWVLWIGGSSAIATLVATYILRPPEWPKNWAWTLGALAYVGFLGAFIVLLREQENGRDWVYLALFSTFATDTSAYFTGRAFGRHLLAPRISPKKTVEGFIGGCAGGFAAVLLLNYFLGIRMDGPQAVLLGLTLPVAAAAGDLVESAMKRAMQIKDASELIPGHGGVLDRLDSVLFTFPLVYLFARWAG